MAKAPYRPNLAGQQKAAFKEANPAVFSKTSGDVNAIQQIGLIERRATAIKERARAHFAKYQETWVAKEAIQLWQKRAGLTNEHPAPAGTANDFVVQSIMGQARRNVLARASQRLSGINEIKGRMENAVIRNRQQLKPRREQQRPDLIAKYAIKPMFTRKVRHD